MKVQKDGEIASDIVQYVDDARTLALGEKRSWQAQNKMTKTLSYLGLQDAARKRRMGSQRPGAWAGSVVSTDNGVVMKSVSQERWEKLRTKIRWINERLDSRLKNTSEDSTGVITEVCPEGMIQFKELERVVGFLVYVAQTYTSMVPYLKGIYLTLNSWRHGRNDEGWTIPKAYREDVESRDELPPEYVNCVPRLKCDVDALMELTSEENPPDIPVRATNPAAIYLVGDASGRGFGTCSWIQGEKKMRVDFGTWSAWMTLETSSNYKEATNLVFHLRRLIASGEIERGSEIFLFTDNEVAERTYFRGSSHSSDLHQMILELRKMEMRGELVVHFIWISGRRMINQGTDGLSRADVSSGVMGGANFLDYLPLDKTAFERQNELEAAVRSWVDNKWRVATTENWFDEVYSEPNSGWIWCPPPTLARIAVEQLCEVRHLYPYSKHIFVCPSLMRGYWLKTLGKVADSVFSFKAGSCVWVTTMFESLTIAFVKPLLVRPPFKVGRSPGIAKWERTMFDMQWTNPSSVRNHMREFWRTKKPGCRVSGSVARKVLSSAQK